MSDEKGVGTVARATLERALALCKQLAKEKGANPAWAEIMVEIRAELEKLEQPGRVR